jgi:serine/threonine protein kinase
MINHFKHGSHYCLVFPYAPGGDLYSYIKAKQRQGGSQLLTMSDIKAIARAAVKGLSFLHAQGVVHCDLKPENILVHSSQELQCTIGDLGSSIFLRDMSKYQLPLYI